MITSSITMKMIQFSQGNLHDIAHFLKVYAYAKTIGTQEQLPPDCQLTLEVVAILHDIACPLCRKKYGNTNGKLQEREGVPLAQAFLADTGLPQAIIDRVVFLIAHHHTLSNISGLDYQILVEADYLVNADESQYPLSNLQAMEQQVFRTGTGKALLHAIYGITPSLEH